MRRFAGLVICALALTIAAVSCGNAHKGLKKRVLEMCGHIPDPERLERSKGFLTDDYYALLEEMVNLPYTTPVLHQWEFWFAAADGSLIAADSCDVLEIKLTDPSHAEARISVHPEDPDYGPEEHTLFLEKERGKWRLADFDGTKQASRRYIDIFYRDLI